MTGSKKPNPVKTAAQIPLRSGSQSYPVALRHRVAGRHRQAIGDDVGITQFGINLTRLDPGAESALRHWHEAEDEFVYILQGELTLVDESGEHIMPAGTFAGWQAGKPNAHHLVNKTRKAAVYLEIGTRATGRDVAHYPDDPFGPLKR
jgi:uncharacterized cupin superfamily protein